MGTALVLWIISHWAIILAVGGALLVIFAVEFLTRERTSWVAAIGRALLATVVSAVVAPAVFYGIQREIEAPERAAQAQREQKNDVLLTDVAARVGNPGAAKELIELRARALFAPSTGDAERFAQELVTQLSEKQAQHKALQDESATEAMKLRLEWEPFLRTFLQQFDERVAALQARGINMTTAPPDGSVSTAEVLLVQPGPQQHPIVRSVRTAGGYELRVYVHTGQVEFGKLTVFPSFYLTGTIGDDVNRPLITVEFADSPVHVRWTLGVAPNNRRSGAGVIGKDSLAEEYRQAVRDGLNRAFEYAMLAPTK